MWRSHSERSTLEEMKSVLLMLVEITWVDSGSERLKSGNYEVVKKQLDRILIRSSQPFP